MEGERWGEAKREGTREGSKEREREGVQGRTGRNSECQKDYKENE